MFDFGDQASPLLNQLFMGSGGRSKSPPTPGKVAAVSRSARVHAVRIPGSRTSRAPLRPGVYHPSKARTCSGLSPKLHPPCASWARRAPLGARSPLSRPPFPALRRAAYLAAGRDFQLPQPAKFSFSRLCHEARAF